MAKQSINPDGLTRPVGPYSQVIVSPSGRLVFIAGQVAIDAEGEVVGGNDIVAQTRQVMENIKLGLEAAGATFADVVKIVNYITDASEFPQMASVRQEYLTTPYPTSTLVEVPALMWPELKIEIEVMAVIPEDR